MSSIRSAKIFDILGYILSFVILSLACMGLKSSSESVIEIKEESNIFLKSQVKEIESKIIPSTVSKTSTIIDTVNDKLKSITNSISQENASDVLDNVSNSLNRYINNVEDNIIKDNSSKKTLSSENKKEEVTEEDGLSTL